MRRTTISIDDELFARVDRLARERVCSFSAALSEIVRAGLGDRAPRPYRLSPHQSGRALIDNLDNLDDLAAAMDVLDEQGAMHQ